MNLISLCNSIENFNTKFICLRCSVFVNNLNKRNNLEIFKILHSLCTRVIFIIEFNVPVESNIICIGQHEIKSINNQDLAYFFIIAL